MRWFRQYVLLCSSVLLCEVENRISDKEIYSIVRRPTKAGHNKVHICLLLSLTAPINFMCYALKIFRMNINSSEKPKRRQKCLRSYVFSTFLQRIIYCLFEKTDLHPKIFLCIGVYYLRYEIICVLKLKI